MQDTRSKRQDFDFEILGLDDFRIFRYKIQEARDKTFVFLDFNDFGLDDFGFWSLFYFVLCLVACKFDKLKFIFVGL